MKGGIGVIIDLIDHLLESDVGFWMVFYCDEESGFS